MHFDDFIQVNYFVPTAPIWAYKLLQKLLKQYV